MGRRANIELEWLSNKDAIPGSVIYANNTGSLGWTRSLAFDGVEFAIGEVAGGACPITITPTIGEEPVTDPVHFMCVLVDDNDALMTDADTSITHATGIVIQTLLATDAATAYHVWYDPANPDYEIDGTGAGLYRLVVFMPNGGIVISEEIDFGT